MTLRFAKLFESIAFAVKMRQLRPVNGYALMHSSCSREKNSGPAVISNSSEFSNYFRL